MLTSSVLRGIRDPELRKALHLDDAEPDAELSTVNWLGTDVKEFKPDKETGGEIEPEAEEKPLQQSDLLRKFYLSIATKGLGRTYKHAGHMLKPGDLHQPVRIMNIEWNKADPVRRPVIIVGAGISGLVAGYELKRAGYEVTILEMSQRFGGRVKTLGQAEGFDRGLHTDGKSS